MKVSRALHVLIVGDHPEKRAVYRHLLTQIGHELNFSEAFLGVEGLALSQSGKPDCILLDYELPDMTGLRFLRELNEQSGEPAPAIVIAEGGNEVVAVEVMRAGAADYIPKNFVSCSSLERAINNVVDKHEMRQAIEGYRSHVEKANRDLRRRNEEIRKFYHTLSHEIKTPLTSAREFVAILLDGIAGEINAEQKEYLEYAMESCDQMTRCINDVLDVARLETGKPLVHPEPGDIGQLVRLVVGTLHPKAQKDGIKLEGFIAENLPPVSMDEGRINQVLTNLLTNAFKFTPAGGEVSVGVYADEENDNFIMVSVRDTGQGIAQDKLSRIFERLYQADTKNLHESAFHSGMGLGLHISQELVRLHGGELFVESEVRKGSIFTFSLPKARAEAGNAGEATGAPLRKREVAR